MKQIVREIMPKVLESMGKFHIVGIVGPRQLTKAV
jgi:hypothetical protein